MQDIVYKLVPGLYKSKFVDLLLTLFSHSVSFLTKSKGGGELTISSKSQWFVCAGEQKRREEFYLERGESDPSKPCAFILMSGELPSIMIVRLMVLLIRIVMKLEYY